MKKFNRYLEIIQEMKKAENLKDLKDQIVNLEVQIKPLIQKKYTIPSNFNINIKHFFLENTSEKTLMNFFCNENNYWEVRDLYRTIFIVKDKKEKYTIYEIVVPEIPKPSTNDDWLYDYGWTGLHSNEIKLNENNEFYIDENSKNKITPHDGKMLKDSNEDPDKWSFKQLKVRIF